MWAASEHCVSAMWFQKPTRMPQRQLHACSMGSAHCVARGHASSAKRAAAKHVNAYAPEARLLTLQAVRSLHPMQIEMQTLHLCTNTHPCTHCCGAALRLPQLPQASPPTHIHSEIVRSVNLLQVRTISKSQALQSIREDAACSGPSSSSCKTGRRTPQKRRHSGN